MSSTRAFLYLLVLISLLSACGGHAGRRDAQPSTPSGEKFYIGTYTGNFYGEDTGSLQLEIDERDNLIWEGVSKLHGEFTVSGIITYSDNKWLVKGEASMGRTFMGFVESDGEFSGTWEDLSTGEQGMFSLRRQ